MTREAGFKRRVRARMASTGEAYSAARAHLDRGGAAPAVLHVTNGDSVSGTLRAAGLGGRVLTWADVLHDGPVPGGAPAGLRRARAAHLAARGWGDAAAIERRFAARDRLLERCAGGRYVLWFEADLYDQLLLAQVLERLRGLGVDAARVTLVSVGEYRGIAHFGGLGELDAGQLTGLAADGETLSAVSLELASAAWAALTAAEPGGLPAVARASSAELRFLGEAFARLLCEYPSRTDGLSLTQRRILLAAAEAPAPAREVFRRVWRAERRPFLGDAPCHAVMGELAAGPAPLLAIGGGEGPFGERPVRVTDAGREVLAGGRDHVALNGIDRWVGGVHLAGRAPRWRYDERLEALVEP